MTARFNSARPVPPGTRFASRYQARIVERMMLSEVCRSSGAVASRLFGALELRGGAPPDTDVAVGDAGLDFVGEVLPLGV